MEVIRRKKLIEVALPLDDINAACAHEKLPGIGAHPRGLHLWWARRPFASARAVIFAQMVDDPSAVPEEFPTLEAQQKERERLFQIIRDFVPWKNASDEKIIARARQEIRRSWQRCCEDNKNHPQAAELFNPEVLPAFHDPFAGGGALPLEAQRLGLESHASDLNPIPVLINKAMIEIPPQFADMPPVNPGARQKRSLIDKEWKGVEGLISDIEYYGQRVYEKAVERMGHLYPDVHVTDEMVKRRPDLAPYRGQKLEVLTYIWARTVKSPNPAYAHVDVPLLSTYWLCSKKGKETYLEPEISGDHYNFKIRTGEPKEVSTVKFGARPQKNRAGFMCLLSGTPIPFEYLREKGKEGKLGERIVAVVCKGKRGRVYIEPDENQIPQIQDFLVPSDFEIEHYPGCTNVVIYGMESWNSLYNERQLHAVTVLQDALIDVCAEIENSRLAQAITLYLSFAISRIADFNCRCCRWKHSGEQVVHTFSLHALPMVWDYSESSIVASSGISWRNAVKITIDSLRKSAISDAAPSFSHQDDAQLQRISSMKVISTDPPYYDNVPYALLSDFFYVRLRRTLKSQFPELLGTMSAPKAAELVANRYRHGGEDSAHNHFMTGMEQFLNNISTNSHPGFPVSIYYAFKQKEIESGLGEYSTGWQSFLAATIQAGFSVVGTWPVRTEMTTRMRNRGSNALATSVVLVCQRRTTNVSVSRVDFERELRETMPNALQLLVTANTAPVDMAQAAIGPGISIFSKYNSITKLSGEAMSVSEALALINEVLDESLSAREADYDEDTRWATAWFSQFGFAEGDFGIADQLARAKNTSVEGVVLAGLASSSRGKVKLYRPEELPADWDPRTDGRLTMWERTNHLVRTLMKGGDSDAAVLLKRMGSAGQEARDLAYQLYNVCEKNKWSKEALGYNALIQGWPEIERMAKSEYIDLGDGATLFDNIDNN